MLWAMPTHSAEKLYVVQVRCSTGTGSRSSLAYGPLGSGSAGRDLHAAVGEGDLGCRRYGRGSGVGHGQANQ